MAAKQWKESAPRNSLFNTLFEARERHGRESHIYASAHQQLALPNYEGFHCLLCRLEVTGGGRRKRIQTGIGDFVILSGFAAGFKLCPSCVSSGLRPGRFKGDFDSTTDADGLPWEIESKEGRRKFEEELQRFREDRLAQVGARIQSSIDALDGENEGSFLDKLTLALAGGNRPDGREVLNYSVPAHVILGVFYRLTIAVQRDRQRVAFQPLAQHEELQNQLKMKMRERGMIPFDDIRKKNEEDTRKIQLAAATEEVKRELREEIRKEIQQEEKERRLKDKANRLLREQEKKEEVKGKGEKESDDDILQRLSDAVQRAINGQTESPEGGEEKE